MWLIRFNKLESRDYNMISRQLEKAWFSGRKISPVIFIKSSIEHIFNKKSWRQISTQLPCSHLALYNFYNKFKNTPEFSKILFTLAHRRIILNIKGKKTLNQEDLLNNTQILELTLSRLADIVQEI